jgi:hypothetical protein
VAGPNYQGVPGQNATLRKNPRVVIAGIFNDWFPADYKYATGPVPKANGKNIFSKDGAYAGPQTDPAPGTSCGEIMSAVLMNLMGFKQTIACNVDDVAKKLGAWREPSPDSHVLPKPGDPYVLHAVDKDKSVDNPANFNTFQHVGFITSAPDPYSGEVMWGTMDGGGGNKDAGEQHAGPGSTRTQWVNGYLRMLRSGAGTGDPKGTKRLMGWADLEVLFGYAQNTEASDPHHNASDPAAGT